MTLRNLKILSCLILCFLGQTILGLAQTSIKFEKPATKIINGTGCGINDCGIEVKIADGTPPYTFLWPNGETTNPAVSLGVGNHQVLITYGINQSISKSFYAYQNVYWGNMVNSNYEQVEDILNGSGTSGGYGDSGFQGLNECAALDLWRFGFVLNAIPPPGTRVLIGLGESNTNQSEDDIIYGFEIVGIGGGSEIFEGPGGEQIPLPLAPTINIIHQDQDNPRTSTTDFDIGDHFYIMKHQGEQKAVYFRQNYPTLWTVKENHDPDPESDESEIESNFDNLIFIPDVAIAEPGIDLDVQLFTNCPCPTFQTDRYTELKNKLDGTYFSVGVDQILPFKYREEYRDGDIIYRIKEISTGTTVVNSNQALLVNADNLFVDYTDKSYGQNRFNLDVSSLSTGYYVLEVENDKEE